MLDLMNLLTFLYGPSYLYLHGKMNKLIQTAKYKNTSA